MQSLGSDPRFVVRAMLLALVTTIAMTIALGARTGASGGLQSAQPATGLSVSSSPPVATAPGAQLAGQGQTIFQQQCAACHTIGGGKLVGPDLQGVTVRRDRDWLARWISSPDKMLAAGDATATQLFKEFNQVPMPNLELTEAQVASLIAYLETQSGGAAPQSAPVVAAPAELPAGDPAIGKDLFTGGMRFQNGGPPCMACHSVAGIGALGGGALGPDLTQALEKYGGARGLDAFLNGVPTATMNAIWGRKPLATEERANILAFLQQAGVQRRPTQALRRLTGLALGGLVILLLLAQVIWHNRLTAVRRPLLSKT